MDGWNKIRVSIDKIGLDSYYIHALNLSSVCLSFLFNLSTYHHGGFKMTISNLTDDSTLQPLLNQDFENSLLVSHCK